MEQRTFIDNAPDEEGVQLLLSAPLTDEEFAQVEKLHVDTWYDPDHSVDYVSENPFINANTEHREPLKAMLIGFGFIEQK